MLDIDSLPIGIKPTNRMNFEELIEEKLKIADQLDKEQVELSTKSKYKKKIQAKPIAEPIQDQEEDTCDESDPQVEITLDDDDDDIEEQVEEEDIEQDSKPKPRPFLKRGEGLKRYQPTTKKNKENIKKTNLNRKSVSSSNQNTKPLQTSKTSTTSNTAPKTRTVAKPAPKTNENKPIQKKIEAKPQPAAKTAKTDIKKAENKTSEKIDTKTLNKVPEKKIEIPTLNEFDKVSDDEEFHSNYFQPKLVQSSNNYDEPHNDTELKEFENLEKYVEDHPSFRSSSSYMEPYAPKQPNSNQYTEYTYQRQEVYANNFHMKNDNYHLKNVYTNFDDDSDMEEFMTKSNKNQEIEYDHELDSNNRTLENDNNKYQNTSSSSSIVSRKIKRISSTNKLGDKEETNDYFTGLLNEKNSDYMCSNYKDQEDEFDNFEVKTNKYESEDEDLNFDDYRSYKKSLENREPVKKVKFDDSSSWLDQSVKQTENESPDKFSYEQEDEQVPVSKLINKLFPSIKEQEDKKKQVLLQEQKQKDKEIFERIKQDQIKSVTEGTKTNLVANSSSSTNINASVLREKINQLESEIELFKRKNSELNKLKEKLDTEAKLAETNRKLFDKQKQEEFNRLKEVHDEEMRKLKQEKKIFEQYKQSIKDKPDRKEREEIERLNKQIIDLTEEMKTRESRWMANSNRLKERIECLEKEKVELKKELQFFEKQRIESLIKMSQNQNQNNFIQNRSESPISYQNIPKHLQNEKNFSKNLTVSTNSFNSESDYFNGQQSNGAYPNLKRTTSEKSLPNSSPSSSSSSMGSTGSLATNSNLNLNQPHPNIIQQSYRPNSITSPLASNSFDSIKSDVRVQNHKSISPQQQNLVKTVKFNPEQLKETRYYSPNGTNLIENEEYESNYRPNSLPNNIQNNMNNNFRQSIQGPLTSNISETEYVVSSLSGLDRKLKVKDIRVVEGKHTEKLLEDDTLLTIFPNGTIKEVSGDKMKILVKFFNGDRKEVNRETGTETYSYAETNITQIIYSNGLEILKFPNGQIEKHHVDKTKEIIFPDKICKYIYADGSEETRLPNGTCIKVDKNGDKIIEYPNKQREIHTKEFKKREYPDGSVKTVYTNGLSETKYSNGRIRLKDSLGNIISDTKA